MPWSVKAHSLIQSQYAATGASGSHALSYAQELLHAAKARGIAGTAKLFDRFQEKKDAIDRFIESYRRYCWDVTGIDDYKLAPFHILAIEGTVYADKDQRWYMQQSSAICRADPELFTATPYKIAAVNDDNALADVIQWWIELTGNRGEGMIVKPYRFIERTTQGVLIQPAVKCRGKEYLRIIYGPEYCSPEHITRLKKRGLSGKRALALQEFALGIEALTRFVNKEPLQRIHESVFAILALESEPIDPRL